MNAPFKPSQTDQLRARDGELCWLCSGKLNFNAPPNSKKAPTKEHLQAKSEGGSDKLDNLVLCHPGCNRQLANRPKADKLKIRAKRIAAHKRQLAAGPTTKPPAQAKGAPSPLPKSRSMAPTTDRAPMVAGVDYWRKMALAAASVALFALGLSLGLLVSG